MASLDLKEQVFYSSLLLRETRWVIRQRMLEAILVEVCCRRTCHQENQLIRESATVWDLDRVGEQ